MNDAIRIFLIDDHTVLREAISDLLTTRGDIRVVGQAGDLATAYGALGRLETPPDLVILDIRLPDANGTRAIPELRRRFPDCRILVFTMYDNPGYVWNTINSGASGYLLKNASREELLRAVHAIAGGGGYLQAEVTLPMIRRIVDEAKTAAGSNALTAREIEILEGLGQGQSNKSMARQLDSTEESIKSHLRRIYEKLGANDRAHAVAIALREQLIP